MLFPAIHAYGTATVAVHTGGAAPRFAKRLRDHVAALLRSHPPAVGKEAEHVRG